jgi:hypothetical protein
VGGLKNSLPILLRKFPELHCLLLYLLFEVSSLCSIRISCGFWWKLGSLAILAAFKVGFFGLVKLELFFWFAVNFFWRKKLLRF